MLTTSSSHILPNTTAFILLLAITFLSFREPDGGVPPGEFRVGGSSARPLVIAARAVADVNDGNRVPGS